MPDNSKVTFKDVAGLQEEKEDLQEIVDFLKEPKKYLQVGAVSLGFAHDYLGRNGLKELMVRTGALWAVSGGLRVEPFLGWYCGYGRDDFKKVVLGLWCSYVF